MLSEQEQMLTDVRAGKYEPWICLGDYLVAHTAELLTKLRDEGHSISIRFDGAAQWRAYLTSLIEHLEAYDVDDPIAYMRAQNALHEIVSHLADFWD